MRGENETIDVIWGVEAISKLIRRTPRQTFHMLNSGLLPGRKVGGRWCVSRPKLEKFFAEDAA